MGRKPNQLILEFFERGPKLEDASNRYQHTCKSCGEKFPKGRIDSLTTHLVKKCPALPLRDRQRAILQFHELPDLPETSQPMGGQPMNLPFAPKQGMSALETLAEVSRQHLDLSGKRGPGKGRPPSPPPNSALHHGALMDEFIVQDDRPDGPDMSALADRGDVSSASALPSIYHYGNLQHSPIASPHLGTIPLSSPQSVAQMVPSLVMAASAANELQSMMPMTNGLTMEPELGASNLAITDKYFQTAQGRSQWPGLPTHHIDPFLQDHSRDHILPKDDSFGRNHLNPRPIAMNPNSPQTHFTTDFSMNQKPAKPKVRGRFSDLRRKEVQEVRKRGACIRCRMLKKPCSGDSPCSTCVNVESARLWKQPCIRTRIAEEFNLYSAGLHGVLAFHAVTQTRGQLQLAQMHGRIEATHYPDSAVYATFAPLKCQLAQGPEIDPAILGGGGTSLESPPALEIIDSDTDDIGGKLDAYIKKMTPTFLESEDSPFMKPTLRVAMGISSSNQDGLLGRVLELWVATRILTEEHLEWHMFSNPSLPPGMAPAMMTQTDLENNSRTPITVVNNHESYDLIKMQLMGALEKRAATLSRVVMNDLERRLLQRQQTSMFETFLVAVVLLACVERMCWLFKTWEDHSGHDRAPQHDTVTSEGDMAQALQASQQQLQAEQPRSSRWPLDKMPAYYSQQGERFSDILYMLLKMRGVPPKPVPRSEDGVLVLWGEDVEPTAKEWYECIGVTNDSLVERADASFQGNDPREWESKYIRKIIGG
ncbi:hypothetical protein GQ43DRAFT_419298 [Delitschia confertaspora ATCC 74209]|uniref:Zn(2)-C6 fungal-type domain-containing protein n=1 Tax=Delitschia confertaspora ATCC 74209 TaxID=1513339 RepID=A0A9P4JMJ9_9PLEO|nr:hypothetical protein GQ43DRAFT_419298 [Delitschia confertaspora ATCC 74209]